MGKKSLFIHRTWIVNKSDSTEIQKQQEQKYLADMVECKSNISLFYRHGSKYFLTKKDIGDQETFYMHTLHFYIPVIMDDTWENFHLGIGIYTMKGFERRNKERKNIFSNHTNKKAT